MSTQKLDDSNETGSQSAAPFVIHSQYLKDFSFENPNPLHRLTNQNAEVSPSINVNLETTVNSFEDNGYEVVLEVQVTSELKGQTDFVLELEYAALISLAPGLDEKTVPIVLMIHVPTLIFPFVRQIISAITAQGAMLPLLLNPIDFAMLYFEQQQKKELSNTQDF
jgi:preprotein translocase subunit SecB